MPPRTRTTSAPTKRAPAKATAKRTPKRRQVDDEPIVIEGTVLDASDVDPETEPIEDPDDQEPELVGAIVPFHGREIAVRLPSLEQLVVMRRLANEYKEFGPDGGRQLASAEEALTGFDRALMTITSVIVNRDDIIYVENLLLQGLIDLTGAGVLLKAAMDALSEANKEQINRAEQRRQAKAKRPAGSKGTARLAKD